MILWRDRLLDWQIGKQVRPGMITAYKILRNPHLFPVGYGNTGEEFQSSLTRQGERDGVLQTALTVPKSRKGE